MKIQTGKTLYHPVRLYEAPKPTGKARAELTTEEKAALWDQAAALHAQARAALLEIDRLRFKVQALTGQRDALFTNQGQGSAGSEAGQKKEPCSLCGMEVCNCERIG